MLGPQTSLQQIRMKPGTPIFRSNKLPQPACSTHTFSLQPRNDYLQHPQRLSLSFCDQNSPSAPNSKPSHCCHPSLHCPVLNRDRSHASPTFILRSEQSHYQQKREQLRIQHDFRVLNSSDEKNELNLPKPKSMNNYCSVCHLNYDDYLSHTANAFHLEKIRKSAFSQHILDLAQKMQQEAAQQTSAQIEQKMQEMTEMRDSEEVEIVEQPQKRMKAEEYHQNAYNHPPPDNIAQNNSNLLSWIAQAPLPSPAEISQLYSQQLVLSQYINMFSTPFPIISPAPVHPAFAMHTLAFPFPIYTLPFVPRPTSTPPPVSYQGLPCIIID